MLKFKNVSVLLCRALVDAIDNAIICNLGKHVVVNLAIITIKSGDLTILESKLIQSDVGMVNILLECRNCSKPHVEGIGDIDIARHDNNIREAGSLGHG